MKKRKFLATLSVAAMLAVSGCSNGGNNDNPPVDETTAAIQAIYQLYASSTENPQSYEEWLASIRGQDGQTPTVTIDPNTHHWVINGVDTGVSAEGVNGQPGTPGAPGDPGANGKSAYELAVENGYTGTLQEWLDSLIGNPGDPGANGKSAYELAVENGYTGTLQEWLDSLAGEAGAAGTPGTNGKSAYELAVENGFEGTLEEWLASLQGADGTPGTPGEAGVSVVSVTSTSTSGINGAAIITFTFTLSNGDVIVQSTNAGFEYADYSLDSFDEGNHPVLVSDEGKEITLSKAEKGSAILDGNNEEALSAYVTVTKSSTYPFAWDTDNNCYKSGNYHASGSKTQSTITFTAVVDIKLSLELTYGGEARYDYASSSTQLDAVMTKGASNGKSYFDGYTIPSADHLQHEYTIPAGSAVTYTYQKDSSGNTEPDCAQLSNITIFADELPVAVEDYAVVNFNTLGGQNLKPVVVKKGSTLAEVPTPKSYNDRKMFDGWFTNVARSEAFDAEAPINDNVTLFAKWADAFYGTIHYNNGQSNGVAKIKAGESFSTERPSYAGFAFVGWYLDEELSQPYNGEAIEDDFDLYAKWEAAPEFSRAYLSYTDIYNKTTASISSSNVSVSIDEYGLISSSLSKYNGLILKYVDKENGVVAAQSKGETTAKGYYGFYKDGILLLSYDSTYSIPGIKDFYVFNSNAADSADTIKTTSWSLASSGAYCNRAFTYNKGNGSVGTAYYSQSGNLTLDVSVKDVDGNDLVLGGGSDASIHYAHDSNTVLIRDNEGNLLAAFVKNGSYYKEADAFLGKYTNNDSILVVNGDGTATLDGAAGTYTDNGDGTINLISGGVSYTVSFDGATFVASVTIDTITFNSNGGSAVAAKEVGHKQAAGELPASEREGFNFKGWFLDDETFENEFTAATVVTGDVTVYAKWAAKKALTFNSNGGSEVASMSLDEGAAITAPANPTKDGFRFAGWYLDNSSFEQPFDFAAGINADTEIFAKWVAIVTVTIYGKGANNAATQTLTIDAGSTYDLAAPSFNNPAIGDADSVAYFSGFNGWFTDPECSQPYSNEVAINENIAIYAGFDGKYMYDAANKIAEADTENLIADIYYEGSAYRWLVSEDGNSIIDGNSGAKSSYSEIFIKAGSDVIVSFDYTVGSENSDKFYVYQWPVEGNRTQKLSVGGADKSGTFTATLTEGQSLELVYYKDSSRDLNGDLVSLSNFSFVAPEKHSVTYNLNYEGAPEAETVQVISGSTAENKTPTRSGYAIVGWYTDPDCQNAYSFSTAVTDDVELYAKWIAVVDYLENGQYKGFNVCASSADSFSSFSWTFTINGYQGTWRGTTGNITEGEGENEYFKGSNYFYYEPTYGVIWTAYNNNLNTVGTDNCLCFKDELKSANIVKYGASVDGSAYTFLVKVTFADNSVAYFACYNNKVYADVTWTGDVDFADITNSTPLTVYDSNGEAIFTIA